MGISSPIRSIELSFNIFSAFLNISSNFAASGSVAARAARSGPTFLDKDMFASPTPSLVNGSKENCPLLLKNTPNPTPPQSPGSAGPAPSGQIASSHASGALRFQPFASGETWKLDSLPRNWATRPQPSSVRSWSGSEPYGDHLIHPRSHLEVWTQFQQGGHCGRRC